MCLFFPDMAQDQTQLGEMGNLNAQLFIQIPVEISLKIWMHMKSSRICIHATIKEH